MHACMHSGNKNVFIVSIFLSFVDQINPSTGYTNQPNNFQVPVRKLEKKSRGPTGRSTY